MNRLIDCWNGCIKIEVLTKCSQIAEVEMKHCGLYLGIFEFYIVEFYIVEFVRITKIPMLLSRRKIHTSYQIISGTKIRFSIKIKWLQFETTRFSNDSLFLEADDVKNCAQY